jgi:hypothetical protein
MTTAAVDVYCTFHAQDGRGLAPRAIWAAAAALPPPQRAEFQQRVAAELKSLPCGMLGPGTLHRVIAAAQKMILDSGMLAVGPSPKHGAIGARLNGRR